MTARPAVLFSYRGEAARVARRASGAGLGSAGASPQRQLVVRRQWLRRLQRQAGMSPQRVQRLLACPPPACRLIGGWTVCGRVRWCPFCYARRITGEAFRRLDLLHMTRELQALELWNWRVQWVAKWDDLDEALVSHGKLSFGNRTLLKGYLSNLTLSPHRGNLLLRHDSLVLVSPGSRWPHRRARRPDHGTWSLEQFSGPWTCRAIADFCLEAFPYPAGWLTADPEQALELMDKLWQFKPRFRHHGLLHGSRRRKHDGTFVKEKT